MSISSFKWALESISFSLRGKGFVDSKDSLFLVNTTSLVVEETPSSSELMPSGCCVGGSIGGSCFTCTSSLLGIRVSDTDALELLLLLFVVLLASPFSTVIELDELLGVTEDKFFLADTIDLEEEVVVIVVARVVTVVTLVVAVVDKVVLLTVGAAEVDLIVGVTVAEGFVDTKRCLMSANGFIGMVVVEAPTTLGKGGAVMAVGVPGKLATDDFVVTAATTGVVLTAFVVEGVESREAAEVVLLATKLSETLVVVAIVALAVVAGGVIGLTWPMAGPMTGRLLLSTTSLLLLSLHLTDSLSDCEEGGTEVMALLFNDATVTGGGKMVEVEVTGTDANGMVGDEEDEDDDGFFSVLKLPKLTDPTLIGAMSPETFPLFSSEPVLLTLRLSKRLESSSNTDLRARSFCTISDGFFGSKSALCPSELARSVFSGNLACFVESFHFSYRSSRAFNLSSSDKLLGSLSVFSDELIATGGVTVLLSSLLQDDKTFKCDFFSEGDLGVEAKDLYEFDGVAT